MLSTKKRPPTVVPDGAPLSKLQTTERLGVQLFFDETTYKLMFEALDRVIQKSKELNAELEKMLADGYVLGGEQSGHVILLDYNTTGDGLITAVQVISAMVQAQRPLSRLAGVMQMMPQSQYAANVDDHKKYDFDKNEKIMQKIAELERKYKDKGRLVVRASGTEPRVRVMIEGPDQREMDRDVYALSKLIEHELRG